MDASTALVLQIAFMVMAFVSGTVIRIIATARQHEAIDRQYAKVKDELQASLKARISELEKRGDG